MGELPEDRLMALLGEAARPRDRIEVIIDEPRYSDVRKVELVRAALKAYDQSLADH